MRDSHAMVVVTMNLVLVHCDGLGLVTANMTVVGMTVVQTSSQAAWLEYHK